VELEIISREPREKRFETPLLFVHGSCGAAWNWDENFLPHFAENGFSAHAVSLRGHGASETPANFNSTSVSDYVADVVQAARSLPRPPVLIGHSLGGLIVQKFLEKYEAAVGILLCSVPVGGMFKPSLPWQLKSPLLWTKVMLKKDYRLLFSTPQRAREFLFSEDTNETLVGRYAARFGQESYRIGFETVFNLPKPALINTPMLVIGTAGDTLISRKFIEKTARAYRADCKIFPRLGHAVMLERDWRQVADFMIEWLAGKIR